MKDFLWFGAFLLLCVGAELAEDYRAERCADHGGTWVKAPGCKDDYCNRAAGARK